MAKTEIPKKHSSMNDASLPPNSHASKEIPLEIKPRAKQVGSGRTIVKHDGFFKKLGASLVSDSPDSVRTYLIDDIIIPGIKELLANAINSGIDALFFGGASSGGSSRLSRKNNSRYGHVSYSKYYERDHERDRSRDRDISDTKTCVEPDDIVFDTRREAVDVLMELRHILEEYDQVTVADLYDAAGISTTFTQNKYGWYNIESARIRPVSNGYILIMPATKLLD